MIMTDKGLMYTLGDIARATGLSQQVCSARYKSPKYNGPVFSEFRGSRGYWREEEYNEALQKLSYSKHSYRKRATLSPGLQARAESQPKQSDLMAFLRKASKDPDLLKNALAVVERSEKLDDLTRNLESQLRTAKSFSKTGVEKEAEDLVESLEMALHASKEIRKKMADDLTIQA